MFVKLKTKSQIVYINPNALLEFNKYTNKLVYLSIDGGLHSLDFNSEADVDIAIEDILEAP